LPSFSSSSECGSTKASNIRKGEKKLFGPMPK
jgi:hypothetical protein